MNSSRVWHTGCYGYHFGGLFLSSWIQGYQWYSARSWLLPILPLAFCTTCLKASCDQFWWCLTICWKDLSAVWPNRYDYCRIALEVAVLLAVSCLNFCLPHFFSVLNNLIIYYLSNQEILFRLWRRLWYPYHHLYWLIFLRISSVTGGLILGQAIWIDLARLPGALKVTDLNYLTTYPEF